MGNLHLNVMNCLSNDSDVQYLVWRRECVSGLVASFSIIMNCCHTLTKCTAVQHQKVRLEQKLTFN